MIGLTDKQRLGRALEDDGLYYTCLVKLDQEYQKIAVNQDVPGYFEPLDYAAVTIINDTMS